VLTAHRFAASVHLQMLQGACVCIYRRGGTVVIEQSATAY